MRLHNMILNFINRHCQIGDVAYPNGGFHDASGGLLEWR